MSAEELRAATQELVDDIDAGRMFMNKVLRVRAALAAFAAPSTPEPSGLPFTVEVLHDELRDVLLTHGVRPFSKALAYDLYEALAYDLYVNLIEAAEDTAELRAALAAPSTPEPSALRAKVEQAFEEAMRRNVRSPEEGADSIDATIGSALIDFRSLVLDALRAAPSTEPALDVERIAAMSLSERRTWFTYEAARLAAAAALAPIVPEPWFDRPGAFRDQMVAVVERETGPDRKADPEVLHDDWVKAYEAMGWAYGPVRDPEAKMHPDMVPYDDLGQLERDKDAVFVALCAIARQWVYDAEETR